MSEATSVDSKKSVSRRLSRSRSHHEGKVKESKVVPAVSGWSCNFYPVCLFVEINYWLCNLLCPSGEHVSCLSSGFIFWFYTNNHCHSFVPFKQASKCPSRMEFGFCDGLPCLDVVLAPESSRDACLGHGAVPFTTSLTVRFTFM